MLKIDSVIPSNFYITSSLGTYSNMTVSTSQYYVKPVKSKSEIVIVYIVTGKINLFEGLGLEAFLFKKNWKSKRESF